jgi:hypothetical protein
MRIQELQLLLDKAELMRDNTATAEIYEGIRDQILRANTPDMGQTVCLHVITMCHPKAWGDMYVEGSGESWTIWLSYLDELAEVANQCGQCIYENNKNG